MESKYLSRKDIESLGFYLDQIVDGEEYYYFVTEDPFVEITMCKKGANIHIYDLFNGIIKNKSELIKLLKQLNIT